MRDITIPTSKLDGKGSALKGKFVGGLRRVASAIEEDKHKQIIADLAHDPQKENLK